MKKLLTVLSAVAVAGAINTASAMDRTGKFGIGYQENIMFATTASANATGTWSLKYGFTPQFSAQFLIGFGFDDFNNNNNMSFGARALYNLVSKENSDFYTGFGIVYDMDDNDVNNVDNSSLTMNVPLGFEWSFAGLPEIGFNAEAGLMINYMIDAEKWQFASAGGSIGGALGLGVHYYF